MKQGLLTCLAEDVPQLREVHDLDAFERPAMGSGEYGELVRRFEKGHQEGALLTRHAASEELESQRRLARARLAFQQIETSRGQPASQDIIQAIDADG